MTMDEFHTTLWDLRHPEPGRLFTVELTDGRRFEIRPGGALPHQHGYANYIHFQDKVLHRFNY